MTLRLCPSLYPLGIALSLLTCLGSSLPPQPAIAQLLTPTAPPPRNLRGALPFRPDRLPPSQQPQPEVTPEATPEAPPRLNELNLPPLPQPPEGAPDEVKIVRVKRFLIVKGSRIFSQKEIDEATKLFLDRDLSFPELLQAANVITQLYVKQGYITTGAFIPANRGAIVDGIVPVEVKEGYVAARDIRVQFVVPERRSDRRSDGQSTQPVPHTSPSPSPSPSPDQTSPTSNSIDQNASVNYVETKRHRLRADYVRSRLALATQAPLNRKRLLEALQLLKLNPLIQDIQAELSEGTRPGEGVLTVKVVEAKRLTAQVLLDNGRSPSVGSFRRQIQFENIDLLGLGDRLFLSFANTNGSNNGDFSYTLPLNPRNGTLSLNIGIGESRIVEQPFDILDIRSKSRYLELSYRQPIFQSPTQEFALGLTASYQFSKATLIDGEIPFPVPGSDFAGKTRVTALRFFQEWTRQTSQSVFALRSQFSVGLGFGSTRNEEPPDGRFFAWRGQAQWVHVLAPDTPLLLRGDLQFADRALVPLEQFGLGGFASVRGYRQDAILSDSGAFASAELRLPILRLPKIGGLLQIAPFVEVGTAWNLSGFANPTPQTLASGGLGLRLQIGDRLTGRFDWGIPFVSTGQSKNTLQEKGLYFSLVYSFL